MTGLPARRAIPHRVFLDIMELKINLLFLSTDTIIVRIFLGIRKIVDEPTAETDEQYPNIRYGASAFFRN